MFALFDGAARALDCAVRFGPSRPKTASHFALAFMLVRSSSQRKGARGVAVHEAARITATAQPGEIWVSDTTRALAAGSGITFEDRGEHELKGIEGRRKLFALSAGGDPSSA